MRAAIALVLAAAVVGASAAPAAVARMFPGANPNAAGLVTFTLLDDGTYNVSYDVSGFAPNTPHGMHVHQYGDITDVTGNAMASHWNPFQAPHACPPDARHVGDMGNVTADANGRIAGWFIRNLLNFTFDPVTLQTQVDNANALGRGVIIHQNGDDCQTQSPPGNAGQRYAIGTIGVGVNQNTVGSMWTPSALSAKLFDTAGNPMGEVWMRNTSVEATQIEVFAKIVNQAPGSIHGLHIHAYGDHTLLSAASAGSHFNPNAGTHGLPYEGNSHMGDLGNVIADNNGVIVHHAFYDNKITFGGGAMNVIGRAVVLHALPDQGRQWTADQTGGAGSRLGMGVLGIAQASRFPTEEKLTRQGALFAYAKLYGTGLRPGASGSVKIVAGDDNLAAITVLLTGLEANMMYAIHVHEFGDLSRADGASAGNHYNPYGWAHACFPATGRRHMGDIGNLPNSTAEGTVNVTLWRDWITLVGDRSIIGRAIVVHRWADDCQTQSPPGNAGGRWLYGIIGSGLPPVGANYYNGTAGNTGPNYPIPGLMARITAMSGADNGQDPRGWVYIAPDAIPGATTVYVNITGVTPSTQHGFHVHTYGDLSDPTGNGAGGHWNPDGNAHALPGQSDTRHAGDLGNVNADANGNIITSITVYNLPLYNLAGRGVVLHHDRDQGSAVPNTGGAGTRIGMGALGILSNSTMIPVPPTMNVTSSSTGDGCPPDQICAGSMASPSLVALLAGAVLLAAVRRD